MKKFFKILMVLALLSGAALSCTKDYSKEIADVQKQNQDLQALVASLQNALNSTNATVSQLSSTSDKQAADIAALASANAEAFATIVADHADDVAYLEGLITDLKAAGASELAAAVEGLKASIKAGDDKAAAAAEKLESEIKACDEKAAKALADAVTTCKEDIAKLKEALEGKITDLETALTAALEAKAGALAEEIEKVDGKATANAAAIVEIDKTLEGIAATLEAYGKDIQKNADAIEANKAAIAAAQADIEKIKEQIMKLSARLTNIVAAPAKNAEIQGIIFGEHKRSIIDMNFVVAPASAAEAIAAGNADVKLVLTNGISRKNESKPAVLNYTVTPDKVTAGENGVINVYAVEDTIFDVAKYGDNEKIYATLIVSGKDEAGDFERISDPVAAIDGGVGYIREYNFSWYKGDEAVPTVNSFALFDEKFDHTVDSVVVLGRTLYYVAADKDWKTLPCTESDILKDYVLKTKIGDTALSIYEVADLFEIGREEVKPHFTAYDKKTFDYSWPTGLCEWEWGGFDAYDDAKKVIAVTADSTSTKFDVKIELPEEKPEEAVGSVVTVITNKIAFGELNTPYSVQFTQRIGKHVEEEKAAEPLNLEFGVEEGDASVAYKYFESVKWLSNTQLAWGYQYWTPVNIYALKDGKIGEKIENYDGGVTPLPNKPKFVKMYVSLPYAKEEQHLRIVPRYDTQKNSHYIAVLEHGDYIDLTVAPYHPAVTVTTELKDELYAANKEHTKVTVKTKVTQQDILGDYREWLKDAGKKLEEPDSTTVETWFSGKAFNNGAKTKITVTQDKKTDRGTVKSLYFNDKDTLTVEIEDFNKFKADKEVVISVKDTIDGVIAFDYTIKFTPKKLGVKVATIDGFVVNDIITVGGKLVDNEYKIDDINLANYFKVVGLDEKSEKDTKIEVKFTNTPKGVKYSESDSLYTVTEGALNKDAKVMWDALKATSFNLTAQALLEDVKVGDPVTVTVNTADPIIKVNPVEIKATLHGKDSTFALLKDLKIFSTLNATKNIYPAGLAPYDGKVEVVKSDMSDWSCTVNGVNYKDQIKNLCSFKEEDNTLTYNAHDALGTVVITIPYKFKYMFGEKTFNVILTIN